MHGPYRASMKPFRFHGQNQQPIGLDDIHEHLISLFRIGVRPQYIYVSREDYRLLKFEALQLARFAERRINLYAPMRFTAPWGGTVGVGPLVTLLSGSIYSEDL